ncbi:hypothetical protein GCM10010464_48130 [Pseudonocardia yunnanensis]|uniref:DUF1990 family protein n=1 Tax=Pseudonocardia yunnanensis TaxID=58107 RepID=A0ABW4EZX5_9PSEU
MLLLRRSRPAPGSLAHRTAIVLRWPIGLALVAWQYMWRTTPIHRSDSEGDDHDRPPSVPPELVDDDLQPVEDGVGPMFHRRYSVRVEGALQHPAEVIAALAGDPNSAAPREVAVFVKTRGEPGTMSIGDEFLIRMPGPWDGPVRVVDRTDTSFRLATLRGHLEAGQIEFRCRPKKDTLVIAIEAWARSGDRLSHLLYSRLRLAKEIQLNLWVETCLRLAAGTGGRARGGVQVRTRRLPVPADG